MLGLPRLRASIAGKGHHMPVLEVQPRDTPAERADDDVSVAVDDVLADRATAIEDWVAPRQAWELQLVEGHEFGRSNNVEARILYAEGEQTSLLAFRLDQLEQVDDTGQELVLVFEERDGIAKLARAKPNGLEVELFHILTFT